LKIHLAIIDNIKEKRLLLADCDKVKKICKIDLKMYLKLIKIIDDKGVSQLEVKELFQQSTNFEQIVK
jgi:hypothetical protein